MSEPSALTADELRRRLADLPRWQGDPTALQRSVDAPDFPTAIRLVDDVAVVAEEMDHHPDIDIRWRTVTFVLSTHSAGGVTDLDLTLAERISALAAAHSAI
jgi:4a-hydroxytetrahydrobiopterin dehydratase